MADTDGQNTGAEKTGAGTQPGASQASNAGGDDAKFTQRDLDERVRAIDGKLKEKYQRREDDSRKKAVAEFLETLGLDADDPDAVKQRLAELSGKEGESKSYQRKLTIAEKKVSELQAQIDAINGERREKTLQAEVLAAAGEDCADPEALYLLLKGKGRVGWDGEEIVVRDEQGQVAHGVSLQKLIKDTLAAKPWLQRAPQHIGGGSRPTAVGGSTGNGAAPTTKEARIAALREAGIGSIFERQR